MNEGDEEFLTERNKGNEDKIRKQPEAWPRSVKSRP
jgi:hypothetical protein